MSDKCCLCFPLECGVKFLAFLITLDAGVMGGWLIAKPENFSPFWPYLAATGAMALIFFYSLIMKTEQSRKFTFFAWVVLIVVFLEVFYAYQIYNGIMSSMTCSNEHLAQRNNAIAEIEQETGVDLGGAVTYDQCVSENKKYLWCDWTFWLITTIYLATVLRRWSNNDDAFIKN